MWDCSIWKIVISTIYHWECESFPAGREWHQLDSNESGRLPGGRKWDMRDSTESVKSVPSVRCEMLTSKRQHWECKSVPSVRCERVTSKRQHWECESVPAWREWLLLSSCSADWIQTPALHWPAQSADVSHHTVQHCVYCTSVHSSFVHRCTVHRTAANCTLYCTETVCVTVWAACGRCFTVRLLLAPTCF